MVGGKQIVGGNSDPAASEDPSSSHATELCWHCHPHRKKWDEIGPSMRATAARGCTLYRRGNNSLSNQVQVSMDNGA